MNSIETFLYPPTQQKRQLLMEKYVSVLFCVVLAANLLLQALILVLTASGVISSRQTSSEAKSEYIVAAVLLFVILSLYSWLMVSSFKKKWPLSIPILVLSMFVSMVFSIEMQQLISDGLFANYNVVMQYTLIFMVSNSAQSQLFEAVSVVLSFIYYMARNYSEFYGQHLIFLFLLVLALGAKSWNHSIRQKEMQNDKKGSEMIISQLQKVLDSLPIGIAVLGKSSNLYTNEKFQEKFSAVDKTNFQQQCSHFQVLQFSESQKTHKKSVVSSMMLEDDKLSPRIQQTQMLLHQEKINPLKSLVSNEMNMRIPNPMFKAKTLANPNQNLQGGGRVRIEAKFLTGKFGSGRDIEEPPSPRIRASKKMLKIANNSITTLSDLIFDKVRASSQVEPFYYLDCLLDGSANTEYSGKSVLDFTIIPLNTSPTNTEIDTYMLAVNDQSYRLEMEKLQEVNLLKNRLLGYISHEVNTPLNVIFLIADTIKSLNLDPDVRKLLRTAIMSAKLLSYVMKNLEWYSKIMEKALPIQPKKFDLKSVILQIGSLFKFSNRGKKIKILYDLPDGVKYTVHTDKVMIEQILFNLISNASKFTKKGFIHISFQEEDLAEENCKLFTVTILDTGVGVNKDTILKLGKFFEQTNDDEQEGTRNTGLGLGLAVSNMLAKALWPKKREGITVDSLVGIGSSFSFRFPSHIKVKRHEWEVFRPDTQILNLGLNISEKKSTEKASQLKSMISQMSRMETDRESVLLKSMLKLETMFPVTTMQNSPLKFQGQETMNRDKKRMTTIISYDTQIKTFAPKMNRLEAKDLENEKDLQDFTYSDITLRETKRNQSKIKEAGDQENRSEESHRENDCEEIEDDNEEAGKLENHTIDIPEYILLVDDNEFNLLALEQTLTETGFKTHKARNGVEAITFLERKAPNGTSMSNYCKLILMDINMPVMDGITCTQKLKALMLSGNLTRIPIIANSANIVERQKLSSDQDVELFDDYVPKPIVKPRLLKLIKQWTEDRSVNKIHLPVD